MQVIFRKFHFIEGFFESHSVFVLVNQDKKWYKTAINHQNFDFIKSNSAIKYLHFNVDFDFTGSPFGKYLSIKETSAICKQRSESQSVPSNEYKKAMKTKFPQLFSFHSMLCRHNIPFHSMLCQTFWTSSSSSS